MYYISSNERNFLCLFLYFLNLNKGNGEGKPGDMIEYTIAGKKVVIPYGYPEETIFILSGMLDDC